MKRKRLRSSSNEIVLGMLQAYLDNLAVAPGGLLRIHANGVEHCDAVVTRLIHSDPNPAGPGVITEACGWGTASFPCSSQPATIGSFGVATSWLPPTSSITLCGWFMPTNLRREVVVFSWHSAGQDGRLSIVDGNLCLRSSTDVVTLSTPHFERQWHFLGICLERDEHDGSVDASLFSGPWGRTGGPYMSPPAKLACFPEATSPLYVGADLEAGVPRGQLDGLMTAIRVYDSTLDIVDLMLTMNGDGPDASASWNFDAAVAPDLDLLSSASSIASELVLHHAPMRSAIVPGPCSDGRPTSQASQSVHFHTDDVEDCGWPCVAEITVPLDTAAGFYAINLTGPNGDLFELPFIVETAASVTLLAPTLTWQAYANLGRSRPEWPGLSHYALHDDGSPVVITTAHKPSQTFASSARLEVDSGDGFAAGPVLAHLLMADLYADYWLGLRGAHGVLDDRAIHDPDRRALDDVRVLILSTHHEYWTHTMLDQFERFLARGGSAIYLGGNGLYWVTSLHAKKPHLMEVRRWGGSQTCSVAEIDRFGDCGFGRVDRNGELGVDERHARQCCCGLHAYNTSDTR